MDVDRRHHPPSRRVGLRRERFGSVGEQSFGEVGRRRPAYIFSARTAPLLSNQQRGGCQRARRHGIPQHEPPAGAAKALAGIGHADPVSPRPHLLRSLGGRDGGEDPRSHAGVGLARSRGPGLLSDRSGPQQPDRTRCGPLRDARLPTRLCSRLRRPNAASAALERGLGRCAPRCVSSKEVGSAPSPFACCDHYPGRQRRHAAIVSPPRIAPSASSRRR